MKQGTAYAKRLKRVYAQVKKQNPEPQIGEPTDALEQLILSALSEETSLSQARKALDRLREVMVDVNEIRVSLPREIAEVIEAYIPNSRMCAARLCTMLNAVFARQNSMTLESLRELGKTEAKRWLEGLNGMEVYHVASVMLWSLGGHAVPVNAKLLGVLRKEGLVHPEASAAEVQSFLERHIPPAEARAFCVTMPHFSGSKPASRAPAEPDSGKSCTRSSAKTQAGGTRSTRRKQE